MTGIDILVAAVAIAAGLACLVAALRTTSALGRVGLLLVLLLAVLIGIDVWLPTWHQIADYVTTTPTEVNR